MTAPAANGRQDGRDIIDALPVGVALYDSDRRLLLLNPAFGRILGLSPGVFRPLSTLADNVRLAAYRGIFGPGDPETLTRAIAVDDIGKERRFSRRHPDGRTFDSHHIPLSNGGHLICLIDTTAFDQTRDQAEQTLARIRNALSGLQLGLAVFSSGQILELHNRRFLKLLGIDPDTLTEGLTFERLRTSLLLPADALRASPVTLDHTTPTGTRLEVASDPLPAGGWSLTITDLTASSQAEADAERRAALLDTLLDQLPEGIAIYGADHRLLIVNDAYRRIMAGAPGDIGQTLPEILQARLDAGEYNEPDPEAYISSLRAIEAGTPTNHRRHRPTGIAIACRSTPLPGGGHISIVTDLTELTEAQAELARRADLTANIVAAIPHGIAVYGPDRRLCLLNDAYGQIMAGAPIQIGETVDEIIGRRARSGEYGPGDPAELAQSQRAHDNNRPQYRRRRRPNGNVVDVRTAPLPDGSHISVVTDVTAIVNAEAELARSSGNFDALLGSVGHGVIVWAPDRRIIRANPAAAAVLGSPEALLVPGRTLDEVVALELERGNLGDGPTAITRAKWLVEQDRTVPYREQRLTRAGRILEVCSNPAPGGGFVTTYTDVTEARETEEALALTRAAATAAEATKTRFLAKMGAELRTPVATILGEVDSISQAAANNNAARPVVGAVFAARVAASCGTIATAANTLLALIDTVLDTASVDAEQFGLAEDEVDLPSLLRTVLRRFDAQATMAEVALVLEPPGDVPAIRADRRRLLQALSAIVSNAIKATRPLGSVSLGARHDWARGSILLEVSDTGPGLAAPELERAFEPFAPLEQSRPPGTSGTGLGLYTSRIIMRAHGGDLTLRSRPGQGTTATLLIPATRVVDEATKDPS